MNITVETTVHAPIEKVWAAYTTPADIVQWNAASDDWHTTTASVELRVGGQFSSRMEAKDGSMGFDLNATFSAIEEHKQILSVLADGRKVAVDFSMVDNQTEVIQRFEPEQENPHELQQGGWQAILNQFKNYCE